MSEIVWTPHREKSFRAHIGDKLVGEIMWGRNDTYMACLLGHDPDGSIRGRYHKHDLNKEVAMRFVENLVRAGK